MNHLFKLEVQVFAFELLQLLHWLGSIGQGLFSSLLQFFLSRWLFLLGYLELTRTLFASETAANSFVHQSIEKEEFLFHLEPFEVEILAYRRSIDDNQYFGKSSS